MWLIDQLRRRPASLRELSEAYSRSSLSDDGKGLSTRTLYNWREKIIDIFDIQIVYSDADHLYHLEDAEKADRDERLRWLRQSLAVNDALYGSRRLRERILLEPIPSGERYLMPLIEAMNLSRRVKIEYRRFGHDDSPAAVVEPFCLKIHQRRWYLLSRIPGSEPSTSGLMEPSPYGHLRLYALDRVKNIEITEERFEMPASFSAEEYFRDYFGVCVAYGLPLERILLRVDASQRDYIETLPLHTSQTCVEENDEYAIYELRLHPTIDFFRAILALGAEAEVLAPEGLRDLLAQECSVLNDIYQGLIP